MFGLGFAEVAVIVIVALLVFGPDKLPSLARQAAQFIRSVRQMADNAKSDLSRELGSDFNDLDLRSLDPREVVRRTLLDSDDQQQSGRALGSGQPGQRKENNSGDRSSERTSLRPGETPPFDREAT